MNHISDMVKQEELAMSADGIVDRGPVLENRQHVLRMNKVSMLNCGEGMSQHLIAE